MTVSSILNKVTFDGNGATTVFPFTFPGVAAADIQVYSTSAAGVIALVSPSLYTLILSAAVSPSPTGSGGSVTMGVAPAAGTLLTIIRTIPLTQLTSLANQGTLYQTVIEAELDILLMQIQQLSELLGRQISVAISDDAVTDLPPAAQRANKFFAFDADGNPIAATTVTGTTVSSAMIPVVSAATLAAGRTAFGLGTLATLGAGAGLQSDGAGGARVRFDTVAESGNQTVTSAFHLTERHTTGAATYTNPDASTLFDGFGYWVYALTGAITLAIDASDSFSGMSSGISFIIPVGSKAYISTDGVATWFASVSQLSSFGVANNLTITATVAGNNLTVAIKDRNGNDPSATSPVVLAFRDPTVANGGPIYTAVTSALSVVAANGASLGSVNSTAFKLWLVAFNDAGTVRLGLINTVSGTNIYPLGQVPLASSTLISAGATLAQTFYTNGAGVAAKAYVILGYMTWETGLATAGTWTAGPTRIQLFSSAAPLPGQTIQVQRTATGAVATGTTVMVNDDTIPQITEGDQYMTQAITPTSAANILTVEAQALLTNSASVFMASALFQDTTANALVSAIDPITASTTPELHTLKHALLAGTSAATTFRFRAGALSGTTTFNGASTGSRLFGGSLNSFMDARELMT